MVAPRPARLTAILAALCLAAPLAGCGGDEPVSGALLTSSTSTGVTGHEDEPTADIAGITATTSVAPTFTTSSPSATTTTTTTPSPTTAPTVTGTTDNEGSGSSEGSGVGSDNSDWATLVPTQETITPATKLIVDITIADDVEDRAAAEAAREVYEEYVRLSDNAYHAPSRRWDDSFERLLAPLLADQVVADIQRMIEHDLRRVGHTARIGSVVQADASTAVISVCADSTGEDTLRRDGRSVRATLGGKAFSEIFLANVGASWRIDQFKNDGTRTC